MELEQINQELGRLVTLINQRGGKTTAVVPELAELTHEDARTLLLVALGLIALSIRTSETEQQ